ncbi:MAG: CotH kinase family protein, partial [Gammaproteobacteria bacterium]
MKFINLFHAAAACAVLLCAVPSYAADEKKKPEVASEDELFGQTKVLKLRIDLSAAAQDALRKEPKTYVRATLREGSQVLNDVAVRMKGNGSFQGLDKKPSLTVKVNEFVKGQKFRGQAKFHLNNSAQDPSYLCETLGGQIFRDAGVPAARTGFGRVELNGRDAGLYVLTEAANKDFLSLNFKKSKGNLYEGSNNDVTDKLDKDSGDDSTEQPDLKALAKAAQEADPAQRWKKLTPLLDLDRFVSFAAAEVLVWHRDGYSMDRNNYRIYHDPASDQMVFLPHGMDLLFGRANGTIWPEWKGLVARAVLETPDGRQRYRERMGKLLSTVFVPGTLHTRIQELASRVRPNLTDKDALKAFEAAITQLRDAI